MSTLTNRRILLAITGGIAAYKSAELTRRLKDAGADVRIVMTRGAQEFITPLTLQALSGHPVHTELLDAEAELGMGHIELAKWADLLLIAPATANCMAQLAQGKADDLLSTICLATVAPIAVAPAMNQAMWADAATQANLDTLQARGFHIWGPGQGIQACGDIGYGRLLEVEELVTHCQQMFESGALAGQHVVITAGPTREAIDPVRYISNHSSGKMGFALAEAAIAAGAKVTLIAGPVNLATPERCERIDVVSAQNMLDASLQLISDADIFIATAAVADYRPINPADQKVKKTPSREEFTLHLVENPDILATVANHADRPFCVGFAAETQQVEDYARAKLAKKNLNMIVANDVSDPSIGFNSDNNKVTLIDQTSSTSIGPLSKRALADKLIIEMANRQKAQQ